VKLRYLAPERIQKVGLSISRSFTVFELLSKHIGVRYVYVDVAPQPVVRHQHVPLQDEVKAALDTIPTALIVRLRECLELGNTRDIDQTIAEIGEYHAVPAQSLQRLAQDFQFDELLALLEGKKTHKPESIVVVNGPPVCVETASRASFLNTNGQIWLGWQFDIVSGFCVFDVRIVPHDGIIKRQ
jgi:hypothetical protein